MNRTVPPHSPRRDLLLWIICASLSILFLAAPSPFRDQTATVLEWTIFFPVRAVLGWEGRSLLMSIENRRLQRELATDRLEVSRLRETARENEALRRMVGMRARSTLLLTPAVVVGRSSHWSGEVLWAEVNGRARIGSAVVSPEGLLGRTARVSGSRVWIETLWHHQVAVSVVAERSREEGILRWDPARPKEFVIDPVPSQADYRTGDRIVTSGLGEIFPHGILVGFVHSCEENPRTQMKRVRVEPAVHPGRARQIFLVEEGPRQTDASLLSPQPDPTPATPIPLPGGPGIRP